MGFLVIAARWSLLTATGMTGVIGAYYGISDLVEDYGYAASAPIAAGFVLALIGTLVGGGLHLLRGRRRFFRLHAGSACLLFGLAFVMVNGVGYYFLTSGALAMFCVGALATRKPLEGDEHYPWLRGFYRT
jgi:hypothetical protein